MLLPLPTAKMRAVSLENHLALAAMRTGNGNVDQMSCLLKAVYLAWFLRDGGAGEHVDFFREAECALECYATHAEQHRGWALAEDECGAIESILALHDRQLISIPAHRYAAAWEQLKRFIESDAKSPLPVAQ
ncbi:hypothetical protein [Paraburkholderia caffeinilytica]|uniref:hypothetical protein n=1 Tax=Paraburkholderia caffeinilytica TaxID=1761016 RepID=UPI003DA0EA75